MTFRPYDWNEALRHRIEYIEDRLTGGSPVVGLSYADGLLLLTVRKSQRKVFEVYDRLMFSGLGNQSDIEAVRLAAIDFAHREGFSRSPEDVTVQRVVGSALSPLLKRAFGDPFTSPMVVKGLFAELRESPQDDLYYSLDYDGEFSSASFAGAIAGRDFGEEGMCARLDSAAANPPPDLGAAIAQALEVWAVGRHLQEAEVTEEDEQAASPEFFVEEVIASSLGEGHLEVGVLDRCTSRENKFRLLSPEELEPFVKPYRRSAE